MPKVRYIGRKDTKADNVAGTDTVWFGNGDVQEVSAEAWAKLSAYDAVWELVPSGPSLGDAFDLDTATDEQIREWLTDKPFKVHHKKTGESLRAAVREALAA